MAKFNYLARLVIHFVIKNTGIWQLTTIGFMEIKTVLDVSILKPNLLVRWGRGAPKCFPVFPNPPFPLVLEIAG